jgi:hypothetical protein
VDHKNYSEKYLYLVKTMWYDDEENSIKFKIYLKREKGKKGDLMVVLNLTITKQEII